MPRQAANPGDFKHLARFEENITPATADGTRPEPEWRLVNECRVKLEPISAFKAVSAGQVATGITHRLVCRWFETLTPFLRVVIGGRIFGIDSLINIDERNQFAEILAIEGGVPQEE